jgi:hypothetical protein
MLNFLVSGPGTGPGFCRVFSVVSIATNIPHCYPFRTQQIRIFSIQYSRLLALHLIVRYNIGVRQMKPARKLIASTRAGAELEGLRPYFTRRR